MQQQLGPYDNVRVGTVLFTLVEPHRGHEVAYNRWYERDHFYAGCLIGKDWFAGRRWVATKSLKELRFPADTDFLPDLGAGSYLATYWVHKGHDAEAIAWGSEQVKWLHENERMFAERDHIHTLMYTVRWSFERDEDSVPAALALDHPFQGLVSVMVDHDEAEDARAFSSWLRDDCLPGVVAGSELALVVAATPIPLPEGAPVFQPENPRTHRRTLLLCFTDADPRDCWATFETLAEELAKSGRGAVSYAAPFIPTIPGTDTYTDQLW